MARVNPDRIYDQFMVEANEENQNFYFVKAYDETLYQRLCEAERNAVLNLRSSGNTLRGALEYFMRRALPESCEAQVRAASARRRNQASVSAADMFDYERYFERHPELGVDAVLFSSVRMTGNAFSHEGNGTQNRAIPRTYESLCRGLGDMHKMLFKYYSHLDRAKMNGVTIGGYNRDKQPYGDRLVCSVIETQDSTACEKQVLCSRPDDRQPNLKHYSLLRIYRAESASEGAIRDEKVLSSLWASSLRDIPNIVRYSPLHVEYDGDNPRTEKKYIVSYDFGPHKPYPLHAKLLEHLSFAQKMMILHDLAVGVQVLHHANMFHRNLQPSSVFVFFDRNSDFVQAKLVGFEYCKIVGDNATVFGQVVKRQREDPSAFFSMTMKQGLKNPGIASRIDWAGEDIYSLGALYRFIFTGRQPQGSFLPQELAGADDELKELVRTMLSPVVGARPKIDRVMDYMERAYAAVV